MAEKSTAGAIFLILRHVSEVLHAAERDVRKVPVRCQGAATESYSGTVKVVGELSSLEADALLLKFPLVDGTGAE
jgi:hypothetical protein